MELLLIMAGLVAVAFYFDTRCKHDWHPDGFADWRCSKCGKER